MASSAEVKAAGRTSACNAVLPDYAASLHRFLKGTGSYLSAQMA